MSIPVTMGTGDEMDYLIYGVQKNPGTMQYLQNQFVNFGQTLTDAGRNFYANSMDLFNQFNGSNAIAQARAALSKISGVFQKDEIRSIWELADLQNAKLNMQRWIMAEPTIRKLYHNQQCDGYSDTYIDMHPGSIGKDHYDYRRVMDGMLTDDPNHDWKVTHYIEEVIDGDRELSFSEKLDVVSTWDAVKHFIKLNDKDPTSSINGSF